MPSNSPYNPNGIYWSSSYATPVTNPYAELAAYAGGGALAVGVGLGLQRMDVGSEGRTAWDLVQKSVRNVAQITPFGLGNTFRFAEFMSPGLSVVGQDLNIEKSITGSGKQVGVFELDSSFTKTKETRTVLRGLVGEKAFAESGLDLIQDGKYQLRFERQKDSRGRGSLFFRETGTDPKTGQVAPRGKWTKLSDAVSLMDTTGPSDTLEQAASRTSRQKTNAAVVAVNQAMGTAGDTNLDRAFAKLDEAGNVVDRSRYFTVPSMTGPWSTIDDVKRRFAIPGAIPSFGAQRWNRLMDATLEQAPLGRDLLRGAFGETGPLSLYVKPGPAHKMFAGLGIKAAKIGAAYMAVEELDHWRRNFGTAGNILISGGTSAGIYAAANRYGRGSVNLHSKSIAVASFFGQLLLPGFDQGIKQGFFTGLTKLDVLGSQISGLTGINAYRRTLEGFLPGISSPEMAAAAAVLGMGLSAAGIPAKHLKGGLSPFDSGIMSRIGVSSTIDATPRRLGQIWGESLVQAATAGGGQLKIQKAGRNPPWQLNNKELAEVLGNADPLDLGPIERRKVASALYSKVKSNPDDFMWLQDELFRRHEVAIHDFKAGYEGMENPLNRSLVQKIEGINERYHGKTGILSRVARGAEIAATQSYHAFMGASMKGADFDEAMKSMNARKMGRYGAIAAGIITAHQFLTGSLFGFSDLKDGSELKDIYAGNELVKVKRGRFWEGGGTPYEGLGTEYMRPHQYALMMSRAREKATWGDDAPSPVTQFFLKNFTYEMERRNYYDRPYPMTGAAFQDVPVIGGVLAATVGKLIKPAKLMHTSDYMRPGPDGSIEFAHKPEFHGPNYALGGLPLGIPGSPFSSASVASELQYKFRDIEGLTGWAKNMVQKGLTGAESFGRGSPVFANAGSMDSAIEKFWEMDIGGALFMSEPIRRLLPNPRSEIEEYNPLLNRMPSWMPNRFKWGDPYRKVDMGWARLPGPGYASMNPMLQGVDSEAYPDIFKYSILADVAPLSREFGLVRQKLYQRRAQGLTSDAENSMMDSTDRYVSEVAVKRDFDHVHQNAIELPGSRFTQALWQGGQGVIRDIAAPFEYLMPMGFRPIQKLLGENRSMIEQYEYERMYGTPNAFWDKPWRDWFRPSIYSAAHMMGFDGRPVWRQEADRVSEHFDKLEFVKWMKYANEASTASDRLYGLRQAQTTRYGINPQGDAMSMYMALPDSEKKFFDAFSFAAGSDRKRILEMVPEDYAPMYQAIWSRIDKGDIQSLYTGQGQGIDQALLDAKYQAASSMNPMPRQDWIGWHKDVEMDDIKLKYVEHMGRDLYDYDLYQKQSRMAERKPYLHGSDQFLYEAPPINRGAMYNNLIHAGKIHGTQGRHPSEFSVYRSTGMQTDAQLYYNDGRESDIITGINRLLDL